MIALAAEFIKSNFMQKLIQIAKEFKEHGVDMYYVGGMVRDKLMGIENDDIDICLVGVKWKPFVEAVLSNYGTVTPEIGKNFPNWLAIIDGKKIDFALARTERLVGSTRQEFECRTTDVTIEQDLERRDLTINSIAKNVLTGELIDPFEGQFDILHKKLTPTSKAFMDDALRVYRAGRFAARFPDFEITFKLKLYSRSCNHAQVSSERVGMELMKLFTLPADTKVSKFFYFLKDIGWLGYHFKELEACIGVPQSPKNHPEGCVFTHSMHCIDQAKDWFMRAVMLCHDLGKVSTTKIVDVWGFDVENVLPIHAPKIIGTKISSIGHEEAGVSLTKDMLKRIGFASHKTIDQIATLVKLHMIRAQITDGNQEKIVRRYLRQLMEQDLPYSTLVETVRCDLSGRPPLECPPISIGQQRADELLRNGEMIPVVTGRLLTLHGVKPGPEMGAMIAKALELQDRGTLNISNWQERMKQCGFKI